jgi:hypothetical protein
MDSKAYLSKSEITTTVWSMKYESVCLTARNRDLASAPVFLSCVTCWKIHAAMSANDPSHSLLSSRCPIPILPRFESPFHEGSLVKLPRLFSSSSKVVSLGLLVLLLTSREPLTKDHVFSPSSQQDRGGKAYAGFVTGGRQPVIHRQ